MKYSIDEAISILQDFVETDRIIRDVRDNSIESDFDRYCERNNDAIESLIEYVYANKCAFKTSNAISKKVEEVENTNPIQISETDLKKTLACLTNCTFTVDKGFISDEQRLKLIDYHFDVLYKIHDMLGTVLEDTTIDIDSLEIKDMITKQNK